MVVSIGPRPRRATGPVTRPQAVLAALALLVGCGYAAISAYWATGGTGLIDTVGGVFEQASRSGGGLLLLGLWTVVVVKLVAAALAAASLRWPPYRKQRFRRLLRVCAWLVAAILVGYGTVFTVGDVIALTGIVGETADPRALAWHAYLWDPWFLVWGLLATAALASARRRRIAAGPIQTPGSAEAAR